MPEPENEKSFFERMTQYFDYEEPEKPSSVKPQKNNTAALYKFLRLTPEQLKELFRFKQNREQRNHIILRLVGIFLTPITLAGALLGYVRGYNRILLPYGERPQLIKIKPIMRFAMILGAILIWIGLIAGILLFISLVGVSLQLSYIILGYVITNAILSAVVFRLFGSWRNSIDNAINEGEKFGSARFARTHELAPYKHKKGLYVGGGYYFSDRGHLISTAGTRSGKFTNIIAPNLLGISNYQGSWVVIDPKAETVCVTHKYQKTTGRKVVILNPWGLFEDRLGAGQSYNPLDILSDVESIHLVDDCQMIAEMIVPMVKDDKDAFFADNARTIVTGLIMHIALSQTGEARSLTTLWEWARYSGDSWVDLITDMRASQAPVNGRIVRNIGNEIMKLEGAGEDTFGSILSTVLQCTDFLKSPALQQSLQSGYDPTTLSDGNTCLYVVIPADKLQSHSKWLRLIVTTMMRSVIRRPKNRVTFLLDEFAALGYLPEIETALSTYAGYELTVWPILQSLIQLHDLYGDNWETFTANTAVRQFFNINDNFSTDYISRSLGETSNVKKSSRWFEPSNAQATARALVTPDEVRRHSKDNIFSFIGDAPPTYYAKHPYYEMPDILIRSEDNPYYKKQ